MSAGYADGSPDLESGWGEVIGGDCTDHYKFVWIIVSVMTFHD